MDHKSSDVPDFVALKRRFDEALTPGQRAEIRRAREPDDLTLIPGYYALAGGQLRPRIVFMFPWVAHKDGTGDLGAQLKRAGVSEMRLFQMLRSESPRDLQHLRRICQHVHPTADWSRFGRLLHFWGPRAKESIAREYFGVSEEAPSKAEA